MLCRAGKLGIYGKYLQFAAKLNTSETNLRIQKGVCIQSKRFSVDLTNLFHLNFRSLVQQNLRTCNIRKEVQLYLDLDSRIIWKIHPCTTSLRQIVYVRSGNYPLVLATRAIWTLTSKAA